jgi:hypothetical protein
LGKQFRDHRENRGIAHECAVKITQCILVLVGCHATQDKILKNMTPQPLGARRGRSRAIKGGWRCLIEVKAVPAFGTSRHLP